MLTARPPPTALLVDVLVWPFAVCVGVAQATTFIIPDAILADIIDYDFLRTGAGGGPGMAGRHCAFLRRSFSLSF